MPLTRRRIARFLGAAALATFGVVAHPHVAHGQRARPPLGRAEIDDIARIELLEDRRELDTTAFAQLLTATHPEIRRRAAIAVGRIADRRGLALLRARALDVDTAVAAATVFAVGQLRDTSTTAWLDSLLASPRSAAGVDAEAAAALGKLKTGDARTALVRFLVNATATPRTREAIGDALVGVGRANVRGDIAPIVRWTTSPDEELRWRATWALFRPRDPAAVPTLLMLSRDRSALVRSWAVRGLARAAADSAGRAAEAETQLLVATRDADRRVRSEAVRALGTYVDTRALDALRTALASPDAWIAIPAAEGLARLGERAVPSLVDATAPGRSCAVRATALQSLQSISPSEALTAATSVARDTTPYCRTVALQTLARATMPLSATAHATIDTLASDASPSIRMAAAQAQWTARDAALTPEARRAARRTALATADASARAGAIRAMTAWADTSDVAWLLDEYERGSGDASPIAASAAVSAIGGIQRRNDAGAAAFFARFQPPNDPSLRRDVDRAFDAASRQSWPAARPTRTLDEYRAIVLRWVVPDYEGKPRPRARWETSRGTIELELRPGDAPLAVDDFARTMRDGRIVGTEFIRVVPDFVDQQAGIAGGVVLRDEVNRHRLTRGNLSWASAGLDTGIPGYTLGHTPQPHNEGDFTSLGTVVRGLDVVDRIELGDRVTGARMVPAR